MRIKLTAKCIPEGHRVDQLKAHIHNKSLTWSGLEQERFTQFLKDADTLIGLVVQDAFDAGRRFQDENTDVELP